MASVIAAGVGSGADAATRLRRDVDRLGPWFHNLHLPGGVETRPGDPYYGDFPRNKWETIAPVLPADLTGLTALDIGCNSGFYSFELAKRGATVLAVDIDQHYLAQARWAAGVFGVSDRVTFRQMQVYDLARVPETFDIVWFMGVFYHLRYPTLALDIVAQKARRTLVFQTLTTPDPAEVAAPADVPIDARESLDRPGWPRMAFIEHSLAGDPTNWWAPNHAGVEALLRSAGLRVTHRPGHEIYVCEPDPARPGYAADWGRPEYLAATGQTLTPRPPLSQAKEGE
jgi:tRNA (mo5U34)-methyltransferase